MLKVLQLPRLFTTKSVPVDFSRLVYLNSLPLAYFRFVSVIEYPSRGVYHRFDIKNFKLITTKNYNLETTILSLTELAIKNIETEFR